MSKLILPRRKFLAGVAAGIICAPNIVRAQSSILPGFPPGVFGSRGALDAAGGGGGGTVSVDAVGTKLYQSTNTSASYTGITVGSGSNRALVVTLSWDQAFPSVAPSSVTAVWDSGGTNQSMTSIINQTTAGTAPQVTLFGLVAPTSGNKTLLVSWTTSAPVWVDAISFTGVNQTGGATSFPNSTGAVNAATLNVTSATGNMVVNVGAGGGSPGVITGTTIYSDVQVQLFSYANYDNGAATVTIGAANVVSAIAATDVKAA